MTRALPSDHASPITDWSLLLRYLHALAGSRRRVRVMVLPSGGTVDDAVLEVEGRLHHMRSDDTGCEWFAVGGDPPPDGYFVGGTWTHLQLDERRFRGGHIETIDDDDYFGISAEMGELAVVVSDANS